MTIAMIDNRMRWQRPSAAFTSTGMSARWLSVLLLVLFASVGVVRAQEADDEYLRIHAIITQADKLEADGKADAAKLQYQTAHAALTDLKRRYPTWNPKVVSYRLTYLVRKISGLSQPKPVLTVESDEAEKSGPKVDPKASSGNRQFRLLEAGAEPRRELRLKANPGEKQTVNMTLKTSTGTGAAGAEMMKTPAAKITFGVVPTSVSVEGIQYETVIEDVQVTDEPGTLPVVAEAMKTALAGLKGLKVNSTVSDRGVNKKTEVAMATGNSTGTKQSVDEMKEQFSGAEFVLPEEPVGAGARWETKQKVKLQGMNIDQTTTYTLESIDGDILMIKSSTAQQAASQKISNPAMPQLKVDLIKMTGTATGSLTVNLTRMMPTQAKMVERTEMNMSVNAGGQKQAINVKSERNIQLESK